MKKIILCFFCFLVFTSCNNCYECKSKPVNINPLSSYYPSTNVIEVCKSDFNSKSELNNWINNFESDSILVAPNGISYSSLNECKRKLF